MRNSKLSLKQHRIKLLKELSSVKNIDLLLNQCKDYESTLNVSVKTPKVLMYNCNPLTETTQGSTL